MRNTLWITAALSVSALLVFSGCSKRESVAEAGIKTQTFYLGNAAEPQDLDPDTIYAWTDSNVAYSLFEALTVIDEKTTKAIPGAAESWDVSPDGKVYTFHLRPTAKWSNGDPVTADDFVYSIKRILTPTLGASYSYMVWPVKNAEAYNSGKLMDFSQVGVKALSPLVFEVTLADPAPYFPELVSHTTWLPVHQATIEKYGKMDQKGTMWTRPGNLVGNGAFILKEWVPNSKIVVEKNPQYWDAAKVRLNKIVFFPIESRESEELAFRAGQLTAGYELPDTKVPGYRKDHPDQVRLSPNLASYYLFLNNKKPPLDNPKVRLALSMAVDRPRISKDVLRDTRAPAYSFVPPDCGGYTSEAAVPDDYEAARKLLAEAGYPGGKGLPSFDVIIYSTESSLRVLETIQATWKKELGVQITISPLEQKTLFANSQSGNYQIAMSAWIADFPDPYTFMSTLVTGNGNNWCFYSNKEFDALIDATTKEANNATRFAEFQKAETLMLHEAPLVPLFYGQRWTPVQPFVKGWPPSKLGFEQFKNVYLEK